MSTQHTATTLEAAPLDAYTEQDRAWFAFWYSHMVNDQMQPPLAEVRHSDARYIWEAGRASLAKEPLAQPQHGAPIPAPVTWPPTLKDPE